MNLALLNSRPARRKLLFADNFDRADAADLGAGWTVIGAASHSIAGTQAENTSGAKHDVYTTLCLTDDNYSQIVAAELTAGATARATARVTDSSNFYRVNYVVNTTTLSISKSVAASFTTLTSSVITALVGGETLRIEVQGPTIRCLLDGVVRLTATDTSLTTGKRVGFGSTATTAIYFENWSGGDL